MEVKYFTCDRCGGKIEKGKSLRLMQSRINSVYRHPEHSIDLCYDCWAALFPAEREKEIKSEIARKALERCRKCKHRQKNGICALGIPYETSSANLVCGKFEPIELKDPF